MNASVDIGNSSVKIGFFSDEELLRVSTCSLAELPDVLSEESLEGCIVCSVQGIADTLKNQLRPNFRKFIALDASTPVPFSINYDTPGTIGADRLAAIAGAILHTDKNALVIDMGTCVTYDLVTTDRTFQGGVISPGFRMRLQAMHKFTAGLPLVNSKEAPELIGKSTESCMQSGAYYGLLGEINQIIQSYSQQIEDLEVIICGGDSVYFEKKIEISTFVLPNLVLEGLNSILRFNAVEK